MEIGPLSMTNICPQSVIYFLTLFMIIFPKQNSVVRFITLIMSGCYVLCREAF